MLFHITPRIYVPPPTIVDLVDVSSDALGFRMTAETLAGRKPYPNKRILVACRRKPRKAVEGLLLETNRDLSLFDIKTRWAINAEVVVTQAISYHVLGKDFSAASDNTRLWYSENNFQDVCLGWEGSPPLEARYDAFRVKGSHGNGPWHVDTAVEAFLMPTIEPERIFGGAYDVFRRLPTREMALRV